MQAGRKKALLLAVAMFAATAGVALWLAGKLPFMKAPAAASLDGTDADAPGGDAGGDASATPAHRQPGPLSSAQLGAPLVHGAWVTACGASDTMKVVVKLDVKMGRAVKIDVKTDPPDPVVAMCVERAAHDLRWDVSPKTDHVTVRY